jgi:signal transduction histidine kinase
VSASERRSGLAARLLLAQTLVALAGAATLWVVAAGVGPPIFHSHLHRAAGQVNADTTRHVEEAFRSASALSVSIALAASVLAALAMSAYLSRRIAGPIVRLAGAARDVAAGHRGVRVDTPALGTEFADLTASFNAMAEQLESVETTRRRLLADLAHEMRTPVATLDAYLEGLEDGVVTIDTDTIAVLRAQTARLGRLAEDVTAVSRAEEQRLDLHLENVSAAELAHAAANTFRDRYDAKGVELVTTTDEALPRIRVDRERIGQVLGNLLDNALRHTSEGGRVTLVARAGRDGRAVELTVSDTGTGIPAEHLPHVFERFYRVDRARDRTHGGSGIGLTIAKALIEAHGGTLTGRSDGAGRGSTFTMTVPARPQPGSR